MQNYNRKITIDDIARDLGISKTTVSRAISGKGRISSETVSRVKDYIEENNYHPSAIARSLAYSRSCNIAFIMDEDYTNSDLPFFQKCLWGLTKEASSYQYDVVICICEGDDFSQLKRLIRDSKIDGVVIARAKEGDAVYPFLESNNIPFVTAGSLANQDIVKVDNDHFSACAKLTEMVIKDGCNKLAYIGGNPSYTVNKQRLVGYLSSISKHQISEVYENIKTTEEVAKIVPRLVDEGFDCILCADDYLCMCVLDYMGHNNINIPGDIKIASFYDSVFLKNYVTPITAIAYDDVKLGAKCAEVLMSMINKEEVSNKTLLGYEIVRRSST